MTPMMKRLCEAAEIASPFGFLDIHGNPIEAATIVTTILTELQHPDQDMILSCGSDRKDMQLVFRGVFTKMIGSVLG